MLKHVIQKTGRLCFLMTLFAVLCPFSLWAQNVTVSGTITDSNKQPVIGATVMVKNTTIGTVTGVNGEFAVKAPADGILVIQSMGYVSQEVLINGQNTKNITLAEDVKGLQEVVVVGYGTQKKATLTGAVSGVKGSEMVQTKNENPQNMLTGRIAGVRVWQKSAEPGTYNANFDIRGMSSPLVVIDGVPRSVEDFQRMNANDIDDISVLKDAAAAIYGVRSGNGVVLVTTKKGTKDGKCTVTYNGSYTLQQPSKMPKLANAIESMTLYNERSMNNVKGGSPQYTDADFQAYLDGTRRTTDWNSLIFSKVSPQTQHDLSISGGNSKTQYYAAMGYSYQEGFFKSGDLNYNKFNLRANLSTELLKGLTYNINLSGVADQRNNPYTSTVDIIRNYWRQGVLYPAYADPANTMLNYEGLDLEENTVAEMTADISGFRKYNQKKFQSSTGLNYDFGTLLPALNGLSIKTLVSFDYQANNNTIFRKEYYQYAYDPATKTYVQKLYNPSSPNQLRREFYDNQQVLGQVMLNYDRTFKNIHKVGAVIGWESQKTTGDNFYAQRNLAFASPYLFNGVDDAQQGGSSVISDVAYSALIGRVNYSYSDRYLAEFQFRYDGSSHFTPDHQWGFFPSASVGWRVSEEPFFKSISALSFVNQLKFRGSYGFVGNDDDAKSEWISGYYYPTTSGNADKGYYNQYAPGYMLDGKFVYGATPMAIPNKNITWSTFRTYDIGVDFEGWNGLFGFSFDYFDRLHEGGFERRNSIMPTVVGATAPLENVNSDHRFGIDLELTHRNKIGDFSYKVKAIGTITRQEYLTAVQNGSYGNSYDQWRHDNLNNRNQGVVWGYESAGRYQNWNDIWNYPIYKDNNVLPGDYKYGDWNGDGEINSLDEHPIAYDQTPWLNYSFSFDGKYKNFDMSFLFQGSALGSMEYKEPLYSIWGSNGGGALAQYLDRWHPADPTADPYDPATQWVSGYYGYTGHSPMGNSEFNRVSTAYLRLKSVEVGYTLPKIKSLSAMKLRVFANAYNLFTITKVKFVDPEHPDDDLGRLYPLNKTYTLGLSLSF
ncbi:MAG: TonB-dependent receptor [Bacteroidota bacterium]|nr:TonB-dependent receptor [Bacteroidota bacterium]